jgi:hypothetical protein
VTLNQASIWNAGTCRPDAKGEIQIGGPYEGESTDAGHRGENSHRPTRRRERQMQRFKSSRHAQDFLSAHSFIYGHFRPRRHQLPAPDYREIRSHAFNVWHQETVTQNAA